MMQLKDLKKLWDEIPLEERIGIINHTNDRRLQAMEKSVKKSSSKKTSGRKKPRVIKNPKNAFGTALEKMSEEERNNFLEFIKLSNPE